MTLDSDLVRLRAALEGPLAALDLDRLGRHNRAYTKRYASDRFERFVVAEWPYYKRVLRWYRENCQKKGTVLEIGTFVPVMPLLLAWDGYCVTTIEKLEMYGNALDPMLNVLDREAVKCVDADVLCPQFDASSFDCVNLLAVVEHLLGSPRKLLLLIHEMLKPEGSLIFAVPNQARLARRVGLCFGGISVHGDYGEYFESEYPYSGHHREYTVSEVEYALTHSGFNIRELDSVRYPPTGSVLQRVLGFVGNRLPLAFHQVLFAVGQKV